MIAWVWLHTGGSVLMAMLMHASNNTIAFVWQMFAGPDQLRLWWLWCALWVAADRPRPRRHRPDATTVLGVNELGPAAHLAYALCMPCA